MKFLLRVWAIVVIAAKRLISQKGLTLATLLGLIVTIALTLSIPLYADAVYFRVLQEELTGNTQQIRSANRSPFAFMFRYLGAWNDPIQWEEAQPLDEYLTHSTASQLGLPQQLLIRYFKTDNFRLFPGDEIAYDDNRDPLAWVSFGFISDFENNITLLEGTFPATAEVSPDSTVEVLVNEEFATELGLQVGETYITYIRKTFENVERTTQVPVYVAGIWRATDPESSYWFYTPATFEEVLIVSEESFLNRISPYIEDEVSLALWYLIMDGSNVSGSNAGRLLTRINAIQQQTNALLPNTRLEISPADALRRYQTASNLLTILLYAFSVPILALILTFVVLVVTLSIGRQRNEIAVLRSRGATTLQIVGMSTLEGLLMGAIALAIGLPLSEMVAQLIGQTKSFLDFSNPADLRVTITLATLRVGMIAVGLAIAAQVIPTIGAARHTIVSYKMSQARSLKPPFWQRAWLDVLLLIPAGYGTYLLQQQESIVLPGSDGVINSTAFQNPLLILVPALGILALTLLFLRILPYFMSFLSWLLSYFGGIGMLLATRQLARTPGFYTAPMILLVLTLSLSTFTASLAQTLDNHLNDQAYYRVGADMSVIEFGQVSEGGGGAATIFSDGGAEDADAASAEEELGPRWLFLPVTEYLKIEGIEAATRVSNYGAATRLSGGNQTGTFMGVDRVNFMDIAYWRWDFSPSYLGDLMNALAVSPDGILLPRTFLAQHALNVGDTIQVNISAYGTSTDVQMRVAGGFDYFPTWYPEDDGPLMIGNLDYYFEQAGQQFPYDVWLRTGPTVFPDDIIRGAYELQLNVTAADVAWQRIVKEQRNPERQGLFGVLSVGFGAAALLTVLGFLLYTLFSFRQRFIELGVLRAVGLSSGQMTIFLAWELAFLILTGLVLGTGLGIWASQLYIPSLQVGVDAASRMPPFLVEIAWPAIIRIYMLFGILFFIALAVLVTLLLRMKIFQAVKLGETV